MPESRKTKSQRALVKNWDKMSEAQRARMGRRTSQAVPRARRDVAYADVIKPPEPGEALKRAAEASAKKKAKKASPPAGASGEVKRLKDKQTQTEKLKKQGVAGR